jgi:hypothetical protein
MLKTHYALGRDKLLAPIITLDTGTIQGNDNTFYFWIKARNRSGYNTLSDPTSLTIPNNSSIIISEDNFIQFNYEQWLHHSIYFSNVNNFNTSVLLYKQESYEPDQFNTVSLGDVQIDSNYIFTNINSNNTSGLIKSVADIDSLPNIDTNEIPNGYRIKVNSTNRIYEYYSIKEYITNSTTLDNIFVINSLPLDSGVWSVVSSNTYNDLTSNYNKELFEVNSNEYIAAPLPSISNNVTNVIYYIVNDFNSELEVGELDLNIYNSNSTLENIFNITVLGYLNLDNYTLLTSGINYVNTVVEYPEVKIELTTPLPSNHAFVFSVAPKLTSNSVLDYGSYITLYPKLNDFTTVDKVEYWDAPVANLQDLKALPLSTFKNNQARYVISNQSVYVYNSTSDLDDDGNSVIQPTVISGNGRWLLSSNEVKDGSITPAKLSSATLDLVSQDIHTNTVTISVGSAYNINLDTITTDYLILNTPTEDGNPTIINITATLSNNATKSIILELRQLTGLVQFHSSVLFPGGNIPVLSGNGKTDLIILLLTKDGTGTLKKRGILVQKDIG